MYYRSCINWVYFIIFDFVYNKTTFIPWRIKNKKYENEKFYYYIIVIKLLNYSNKCSIYVSGMQLQLSCSRSHAYNTRALGFILTQSTRLVWWWYKHLSIYLRRMANCHGIKKSNRLDVLCKIVKKKKKGKKRVS
jgi:hypothetical protein